MDTKLNAGDTVEGVFYMGTDNAEANRVKEVVQVSIDDQVHYPVSDSPFCTVWGRVWKDYNVENDEFTVRGYGTLVECAYARKED